MFMCFQLVKILYTQGCLVADFVFEMVIICIRIYVTFHSSNMNMYVHMFWPVLNSKDGNKTFRLIEVLVSIKMCTIS